MKRVNLTPEAQLLMSTEWCEGRTNRRYRLEVAPKWARFLARAGAGWAVLAKVARPNAASAFDTSLLPAPFAEILAFELEWLRKLERGEPVERADEEHVDDEMRKADAFLAA